jgi:thiosulfate dehydrogenase (quinone) large subunit
MRISNKTVAYALLRVAFGVNFLGHGVFRILSGTGKFAAMMADSMAKSPLPHGLTVGFLSAVPVIETVLGVALILGLMTRVTLVGGAIFMWALTFGVTSNQQWDVAGQQLLYSLVFFVLLFTVEFNGLAVDGLLGRTKTAGFIPRIRSTERLRKGMVVVFDDGMTALYSPELLYAILAKAEILDDLPNPDEE